MSSLPSPTARMLGLAVVCSLLGNQPCGPLPGDALEGQEVPGPVSDWSFSDAHSRCHLEVRPSDPHSITTTCYVHEGQLYVPARMGDAKKWTKMVLADPRGRIRIGERIYPVRIERVEDDALRRDAALSGWRKYNPGEASPGDFEISEDHWIFELQSR